MPKTQTKKKSPAPISHQKSRAHIQDWLQLAQLRSEKCEIKEACVAFTMALNEAKVQGDMRACMEAIGGLLRLASQALDEEAVRTWDIELDQLMSLFPDDIPPLTWHCKAVVAAHFKNAKQEHKFLLRYLRAVRKDPQNASVGRPLTEDEAYAKAWLSVGVCFLRRGHLARAQWLGELVLSRYGEKGFRGINGVAYLLLGNIAEKKMELDQATSLYQKAHTSFLGEHHWYNHLYVLYAYARIARLQQNYTQAYWFLEMVDRATAAAEFGALRREIQLERSRLQQDAVDLLIDGRQCLIRTRESGEIALGKQYVLLHILEALSAAHGKPGADDERGLSKAEIIQRVWKENYRPEAHDNKLYYNINRLRKLIEPDVKKPQYLLNWKEGYRLAPGLRVQFVGGRH